MVFNTNILAGSGGQAGDDAFSPLGLQIKNSAGSQTNYLQSVCSANASTSSPFSNRADNGKKATVTMWYYPLVKLANNSHIFTFQSGTNALTSNTPYSFFFRTDDPTLSFQVLWRNAADNAFSINQIKNTFILNQWNCMLFSFNASATDKSIRWYHNDVDQSAGLATNTLYNFGSGATNYGTSMSVASKVGQAPFAGAIAELYYAPNQFIDFDIEANRRLFLNADGTPVDLGEDGSTPTGSKPITYLSLREGEGAEQFGVNRGIGADLSVVGNVSIFADAVSCSIA